jgi:hypothetical protein
MPQYAALGVNTQTGEELALGEIEQRSGLYVLGKPGMGKSSLIVNLMTQLIQNGYGLFFCDPHGQAITDLTDRFNISRKQLGALGDRVAILDPEHETHSFGINLLSCNNIKSLKARTETYARAYNVFFKLWEHDFGPWLQLILQNTLWAFIENQDYTLAEVPLFLNPRNSAFRNHIISNIKYNPAVADFWTYEFFQRREREQQERVDAALTRVTTLLTHPYIRDIIGQRKQTVDFNKTLRNGNIMLVNLSANLAPDIKKFIGTLLISELLHAVRNRPEDMREHFGVYIDEFQNFTDSDDFKTLITEARKFGITACVCHVERYGQLAENQALLGATAAAANKVFFQLTVKDAQELALEFADMADEKKTRLSGELIVSPHAMEDIWDRGHPDQGIMQVRHQYFWLVDVLRAKPNETYYAFDPEKPRASDGNTRKVNPRQFADWDMYRSSQEMIKEGFVLLNHYYYDRMQQKPNKANTYTEPPITEKELHLFLKIIECFAGVFGWRPTMQPYIPPDMRALFVRRINDHLDKNHRDFVNEIQMKHRAIEHDADRWLRANPYHFYHEHPPQGYALPAYEIQKMIDENKPKVWSVHEIPSTVAVEDIPMLRNSAIAIGFTQAELEKVIQWQRRPLHELEENALQELIRIVANRSVDSATYERECSRVYRRYTAIMATPLMQDKFGEKHAALPFETVEPYLRKITERLVWQLTELQHFLYLVLRFMPVVLERDPVLIPSTKYDEEPTREKTQGEMIDIMARELAHLPRFTAYAKIIDEREGKQVVVKQKIETYPLGSLSHRAYADEFPESVRSFIEQNTIRVGYAIARDAIEEEIQKRQEKWRRGYGKLPPPSTHTGGSTPPALPSGGSQRPPPPTSYIPGKPPAKKPTSPVKTQKSFG